MSSVTVNTELRTRYNSGWVTHPPTEFPNETLTPPNPQSLWARFSINTGDDLQMDIGSNQKTFRKIGIVVIQLFAPLNEGNNAVLAKADEVANVFRNWGGTTVQCRAASINEIGNDGEGWYQVNVSIPFKTDYLA